MKNRLSMLKAKALSKDHKAEPPVAAAAQEAAPEPAPSSETYEMPAPWTSSQRAEPTVLHGYTLTKEVSFRDVCYTIRDYAFKTSSLPLIVSLEVHACLAQQEIMVEHMERAWRGLLVDVSPDLDSVEGAAKLPSPEDLRNKILIKVKWVPPEKTVMDKGESNNPLEHVQTAESDSSDDRLPPDAKNKTKAKKSSSKILRALSRLGVYTRAYHFKSFDAPEANVPVHVFSLSEAGVKDAHEKQAHSLFAHNRNYMMRAYPSGMRVTSSNLDPTFFWRQGVQMVALNWQKWDKGMMLNEAMFSGEQGWVLKPQGYRGTLPSAALDEQVDSHPAGGHRGILDLEIEVLAGQDIPLPLEKEKPSKFHPYVLVQLHVEKTDDRVHHPEHTAQGMAAHAKDALAHRGGTTREDSSDEDEEEEFKGKTRTEKGCDPDFGGETFRFEGATGVIEALSFVR